MVSLRLVLAALMVLTLLAAGLARARREAPGDGDRDRERDEKLFAAGNYKDAYEGFRKRALDPMDDPTRVGDDLNRAITCLRQLGRFDEIDAFRDAVVAAHKDNWRLLKAAAISLHDEPHNGFIVAGAFHRGPHRGGGQYVSSYERDRAHALQLLFRGLDRARADADADRPAAGQYLMTLAQAVMTNRGGGEAWRLQTLTPLDTLPDYDENPWNPWAGSQQSGAPVTSDGTPVYHRVPEGFVKARSDGERWRWALAQAAEADAGLLNESRLSLANFLLAQFGTQTIAGMDIGDSGPEASGPYALHTLSDEETIARLATGIRRFRLPDEFNPIKIFQSIADAPKSGPGEQSLAALAAIFENRRQFDRAVEYLKKTIATYGDVDHARAGHVAQILGNWCQFDTVWTQPAGRGGQVDFRFRNGRRVRFEAHELHYERLLADVQDYLKSSPKQLDWQKIDLSSIGARLVGEGGDRYRGKSVATWDLDLDPLTGHFDRRITVTTPLQKAGAYLLTAHMEDGNVSRIVVWLDDTAIVRKPIVNRAYYFIADARTGRPVPRADVEFFGWRSVQVGNRNEFRVETKSLSRRADDEGQLEVPNGDLNDPSSPYQYQWVVTARTPEGRLAFQGFSPVWGGNRFDPAYDQIKIYTITDRPVYRPGHVVKYKFWVAHARYDQPQAADFAGRSFNVEIHNPRGEKIDARDFKADAFGGFDGSFELPSDAPLGVYQVYIPQRGGGSFRVEEYKKPEFEVSVDAPDKPVMLGEKVAATIKANYYFGGPVSEAKVKYKVTRTTADARWYPIARWDWLFGSGYWWFAADSSWYPGWSRWGMLRPIVAWWGNPQAPPEVVAEAEVPIRHDGTFPVEIDTALAKATHPDHDHRYEITAEVTDQSRRTIVGTGTVLVSRRPFAVYTWVDRGHYRAGDTIEAGVKAQTLDHKPVAGKGTLRLLKIAYDGEGKPVETPVETWDLALDADGQFHQPIKAAQAGQYRLSATIDDGRGHAVEGGYLLTVTGQGFDGASYRYNDLELIPDRKEYRPGEVVRLQVNTNQVNATVLLFLRPSNGAYLPPKVIHLRGKSTIEEVGIVPRDMPNIFVEALTIADGKVHSEVREIAVPPESRVADVTIEASQKTYKPGQKARVKVKLTGPDGKPFAGSTVLAVYDKAVEYVSGGSNVPEIKAFFWQWKRSHFPQTESSLNRWFPPVDLPNEVAMQQLGVFGEIAEGWMGEPNRPVTIFAASRGQGMMGGMGGMAFERLIGGAKRNAPMAAAPMAMAGASAPMVADMGLATPAGGKAAPAVQPVVRTNFADTAFWAAAVDAGPDGIAEVDFSLPQSLTTWKVKGWTMGPGTKVGQGDVEIITTKDLLVRLQAPRFFVEKDEVVLSANVHNKLKTKKSVQVLLEFDGSELQPMEETARTVEIDAGGERRVDWRVKVVHEGQAVIRMKALTDEESDAAQMTFPAYVHGMLKTESFSGAIRPDQDTGRVVLRVPAERKPEQSRLEVRYSPTLAGALVDALPYLADYPYGCTEQTLNRFLPTVITQKVLINLGVDLKAIREKHTNLNAQEIGDARERAKKWRGYEHNAVFDADEVARMARAGLQRLADMQLSDGGWGWFSGFGEHPSAHMTALVVHGLHVARRNDLAIPQGMAEKGLAWLTTYQGKQVQLIDNAESKVNPSKPHADDLDAMVFMTLAEAGSRNDRMLAYLDRDRTKLSVYGKSLFGLGLEILGEKAKLAEVMRNIGQYVVRDDENQTAYLKLPNEGYWWWWYGSEIETHAFYLKLLAKTEPRGDLAPRMVKYLLNNRSHGAYWKSTRDTAFCVEAMADFLRASGEDRPDMTVAIAVDGQPRKEVKITPADLFAFDNGFAMAGAALTNGEHTITLTRRGSGPLYYNAYLTNFTLEDPITRAGLEVKVDRKVYRLIREEKTADVAGGRGESIAQRVERYRREPMLDGATFKSGDLVEVELEIDSKNDYEYLLFEDYKAAGFEPVEVRSGYNGNDLGAYVEFRDERVAFFARTLARGKHSVSYRLRAEIPGRFHALPARAEAMYAPELRANSDEIRLRIED